MHPAEVDEQLRDSGVNIERLLARPGGVNTLADLRSAMARIMRSSDLAELDAPALRPPVDITYTKAEVDEAVGEALRRVKRIFADRAPSVWSADMLIDEVARELGVLIPDA